MAFPYSIKPFKQIPRFWVSVGEVTFWASQIGSLLKWQPEIRREKPRWCGCIPNLLNGDFRKWWVSPTTIRFPTKNDHFGVWNGGKTHHLRKHPNHGRKYRSLNWWMPGFFPSTVSFPFKSALFQGQCPVISTRVVPETSCSGPRVRWRKIDKKNPRLNIQYFVVESCYCWITP